MQDGLKASLTCRSSRGPSGHECDYHISQSLREAASRAKLSERWCSNFQNVIRPDTLHYPNILKTHNGRYSSYDPSRPPQEFHGSYTPEYFATHLYKDWSATIEDFDLTQMGGELRDILEFATGHPVFATLRRIDVVFRVDPDREQVARRHAEEIVRCMEAEWKRRGVHDGVVKVYWEFSTEWSDFDWEHPDGVLDLWNDEDMER